MFRVTVLSKYYFVFIECDRINKGTETVLIVLLKWLHRGLSVSNNSQTEE